MPIGNTFGAEPENGIPVDDNVIEANENENIEDNTGEINEEIDMENEIVENENNEEFESVDNEDETESNEYDDNNENQNEGDVEQSFEPQTIVIDGIPIKVNSPKELQQILNSTMREKKFLESFKDDVLVLEGLKENGITEEHLFLFANALKGDKKAIAKLMKTFENVELDDIDENEVENYQPTPIKANEKQLKIKQILIEAQKHPHYNIFENFLQQELTEKDREVLSDNPELLASLRNVVLSPLFQQALPEYTKMKLTEPNKSRVQLLIDAVKKIDTLQKQKTIKQQEEKIKKVKKASVKKTKQTKTNSNDNIDLNKRIEEMTDEEFNAYYEKIMFNTI